MTPDPGRVAAIAELDLAEFTFKPWPSSNDRCWMIPGMEVGDSPYSNAAYELACSWFARGDGSQIIWAPRAWDHRASVRGFPLWAGDHLLA